MARAYITAAQIPDEITFRGYTYNLTSVFKRVAGFDKTNLEESARLEALYARRDGVRACVKKYPTLQSGTVWAVYEGPKIGV